MSILEPYLGPKRKKTKKEAILITVRKDEWKKSPRRKTSWKPQKEEWGKSKNGQKEGGGEAKR